jgi:hypothetical protein
MWRRPMPTSSVVILAGAFVALLIPLCALEVLSDIFPRVQNYKGWLSLFVWAAIIAVVYFIVAPSVNLPSPSP